MSVHITSPTLGKVSVSPLAPIRVCASTYKIPIKAIASPYPSSKTNVTIGLVCGIGKGIAVLCGSDGALVTIDGNYLIVRSK